MYEVELKAHVADALNIERELAHFADFASHCRKKDSYWTIGGKTLRIREQQNMLDGTKKVLVTQKLRNTYGALEVNNELEFELASEALPVFAAILENTGFIRTIKKAKNTKVFMPRLTVFEPPDLADVQHFSIELSHVDTLGWFVEIELLYLDGSMHAHTTDFYLKNAQKLFYTVLDLLCIPHTAIEQRSYAALLAKKNLKGADTR
ncbi:MAG: adenylate cyclase [Treponema sp.]